MSTFVSKLSLAVESTHLLTCDGNVIDRYVVTPRAKANQIELYSGDALVAMLPEQYITVNGAGEALAEARGRVAHALTFQVLLPLRAYDLFKEKKTRRKT